MHECRRHKSLSSSLERASMGSVRPKFALVVEARNVSEGLVTHGVEDVRFGKWTNEQVARVIGGCRVFSPEGFLYP
jgi:hypothetical protein